MKKIRKSEEVKCDLCGAVAKFYAPTYRGAWANMCKSCFALYGRNNGVGYEFVYSTPAEKINSGKVETAGCINTEEVIDEDAYPVWKCPICGEERELEVDSYEFICNCGAKVVGCDLMGAIL